MHDVVRLATWAKECVNEPDGRGKRSSGADATSSKAGFFEVGEAEGSLDNSSKMVTRKDVSPHMFPVRATRLASLTLLPRVDWSASLASKSSRRRFRSMG